MKTSNAGLANAGRVALVLLCATLGFAYAADEVTQSGDVGAQSQATPTVEAQDVEAQGSTKRERKRKRRRGAARDIELQTTSVSGNRELPRVMVVVPWKSAAPAQLGGRPLVSLVEEALTPIDPEVFRRELEYYGLLHGGEGEGEGKSVKTANNLTED